MRKLCVVCERKRKKVVHFSCSDCATVATRAAAVVACGSAAPRWLGADKLLAKNHRGFSELLDSLPKNMSIVCRRSTKKPSGFCMADTPCQRGHIGLLKNGGCYFCKEEYAAQQEKKRERSRAAARNR